MADSPPPVRGVHLLEATAALIAEGGLAAVSIRGVAARAAVSLAQVQYYFRTKEALVEATFDWFGEAFAFSLSDVLAEAPSIGRLSAVLERWLPLDREREDRTRIWLALVETGARHPAIAERTAALDQAVRDWIEAELIVLTTADPGRGHSDLSVTATQLLALVDGVSAQALALPLDQRAALIQRTLTPFLTALPPGPGRT